MKLAFVGAKKGELTVMISPIEITMGVDLAMPVVAPFMIKAPLSGSGAASLEILFADMVDSLVGLVHSYLEAQGIEPEVLEALDAAIRSAVNTLDNRYTDERYSTKGSGVLETVRDIEAETMFEAEFDVPEGFLEQAHRKVVTANAAIIRRTPLFQPKSVKTGPQTQILQRPTPSLKNIIQKYRTQQQKPVSGPLFVLVYDSTGRPVGVRSIKGPGWSGIGGGGKIAAQEEPDPPFNLLVLKGAEERPAPEGTAVSTCTRRTCTQCGEGSRCRCMSEFHDPDSPDFKGAIKVEHILCDGCAQAKFKVIGGGGKIAAGEFGYNYLKNELLDALRALPYAGNIRVFGSTADGKEVPGDIDAILYVPKMTWEQFVTRPASGELLTLARKYYGSFDPFVLLADCMICRNDRATGWEGVKNPKEMAAAAKQNGKRLSDIPQLKTASKDTIEMKGYHVPPAELDIYLNPSHSELIQCAAGDEVRAFVFPDQNQMVAWSACEEIHAQVAADYLPLVHLQASEGVPVIVYPREGSMVVTDFSKRTRWYHNPETSKALADCPALRRSLGQEVTGVGYFDESITGAWDDLPEPGVTTHAVSGGSKISSLKGFERMVVATSAGAIVGTLRFADYPRDRRILSIQAGISGTVARMVAALGTEKPIFAVTQTNQNLDEMLDNIATKTSKRYENEGLEELGFSPVGKQLVKEAGVAQDITALKPSTVLSVFHGCSVDDARRFCTEGIDAVSPHGYRKYPHTDQGQPVLSGLFVAPDLQTARQFGRVVIKFKTVADDLHYLYPSQEAEADDMYRDRFPKSFRPSLSQTLVGNLNTIYDPRSGGYAGYEHQALFLGTVSPRAIEKVYVQDPQSNAMEGMSAEAFLADHKDPEGPQVGGTIEPQETFSDLAGFLRRFSEVNDYPLAELEATMSHLGPKIVQAKNPLDAFDDYFGSVPRVVLSRVLPLLMAAYPPSATLTPER